VTPHQPEWEREGVWRVVSGYEFDPIPDVWDGEPDFGHILRVEPLGEFNHRSARVNAGLRRALTTGFRTRMRQLHEFSGEVLALVADPAARGASDAAEHFGIARAKTREALGKALLAQYGNADFEQPVKALLETLYPDAVTHTAGPNERGQDIVVEDVDRLGLTRNMIVQVKSWSGPISQDSLDHGLAQLANGIAEQGGGVDMAVLLTLGDSLPPDADRSIALAREGSGVPTRVLLMEETLDLMLDQIGSMRL
jgi:hypothetical protein